MRKYWYVIKISLIEQAIYPVAFFIDLLGNILILCLFYFFLTALFASRAEIVDLSKPEIITYYVLTLVIRPLTVSGGTARTITKAVKRGELSMFLIKPINFNFYQFCTLYVKKVFSIVLPVSALIISFWLLPRWIIKPQAWEWFITSLILATLLNYFLYSIIGSIAFWTINTWGIISIYGRFSDVLSGALFPLDFLPSWALNISSYLPFKFMHSAVINIYLGRIPANELWLSIINQAVWVGVLYLIYQFVWRKGTQKYDAVGN